MKLDEPTKDRLRELGADEEMLRWLEHPEAVRAFMEPTPMGYECCSRHGVSHEMTCKIAAAWRTLGDPRGEADVMNAWDDAAYENELINAERPPWPSQRYEVPQGFRLSNLLKQHYRERVEPIDYFADLRRK